MAKTKKYTIEVRRYYFVCDQIEVNASSEEEACELAEAISGDKDYTGQLSLDEVVTEVF